MRRKNKWGLRNWSNPYSKNKVPVGSFIARRFPLDELYKIINDSIFDNCSKTMQVGYENMMMRVEFISDSEGALREVVGICIYCDDNGDDTSDYKRFATIQEKVPISELIEKLDISTEEARMFAFEEWEKLADDTNGIEE